MNYRESGSKGYEGALLVLCPLPFLLSSSFTMIGSQIWFTALLTSVLGLLCAISLPGKPLPGKLSGFGFVIGCYICSWPQILHDPFAVLSANVLLIGTIFFLSDFKANSARFYQENLNDCCRNRAWCGHLMVFPIVFIAVFLEWVVIGNLSFIAALSMCLALVLHWQWARQQKSMIRLLFSVSGIIFIVFALYFGMRDIIYIILVLVNAVALLSFPRKKAGFQAFRTWAELFLNHPARLMLTTFLGLCALGTFLLSLSSSSADGHSIDLIDSLFTSVSAVCVTGLIVLDTPNDFSVLGQFCILLLIQLGGLGIMTVSTVALHAMGKRLSLKQESLLSSMNDSGHIGLVSSLVTILKFTFLVESFGAITFFFLFRAEGDAILTALWRGLFTAISAFCNAGFALQSDSLIPYQSNPLILYTTAGLIILGGMAPATSLLMVRWVRGKPVPLTVRIVLMSTCILLVGGFVLILAFEWNGVLSGLSVADKIHNAWFQSATLRTAGFNSVDIAAVASPTFLVMVAFMFIGGSPGGTAGGVKTTTVGILLMTFWANLGNKSEVVIHHRRISSSTIYRAITIIISGMVVWFGIVFILQVTQQIPARSLIFEVTSALATVGLSTGATAALDAIGKVAVIIAMFVGRIGPLTLFMLLSREELAGNSSCRFPVEKVSLT